MPFAQRKKLIVKIALLGILVYALIVLGLTLYSPAPDLPFSVAYGRWLLGIPATLAVWFTIEYIGTWSMDRPFWNNMPSWGRIVLLVLLIAIIAAAAVGLTQLWPAQSAA
jgi:hypothetical protein